MFNKVKPYTELLGKTNRIVEGTIIKGDVSQADFRLDGNDWKLFSTGKLVIGPAGIITGDIQCKNADIEGKFEELLLLRYLT
jgi:cytoskeletal protein CcmA (bactofilin family)